MPATTDTSHRARTAADLPAFPAPPAAYASLTDEPVFDPTRHLALTAPEQVLALDDLGYGAERVAAAEGPTAVTGPFRVLSDEGLAALRAVCDQLEQVRLTGEDDRAPAYVAGAGHRSRFLRDLCHDPSLLVHLSAIAGTALAPHTLPDCQAYVNFAPEDIDKAVDSWHVDSVPFDIVVMVTDPHVVKGGRFEWFRGTDEEAADLVGVPRERLHLGGTNDLPADRVLAAPFPAAGWAVLQQGTHVVHRATRLEERAARTTAVLGFTALGTTGADPTNIEYIASWPHPGIHAELARHAAWRAEARLAMLRGSIDPDVDPAEAAAALRAAVADVERTAAALDAAASAWGQSS